MHHVIKTWIDGYSINILNGLLVIDTNNPNVIDIMKKIETIARKTNKDFNNLFNIYNSDIVKVYGLKRIKNNKNDFLLKFRDNITKEIFTKVEDTKVYYQKVWNRGIDIHISSKKYLKNMFSLKMFMLS